MLPVLAKQAAKKDIAEMKKTMVSSLTMVFALTLPATAGLIILSEPIIRLIFEHGAFTPRDTLATSQTLALYSIGLFAYSANKILVPAFYAIDKTRYPVIASFLAIIANIIIINLTIDRFQHLAIAFSTSCTMLINFLFLIIVLYINLNGFSLADLGKGLIKIIIATLGLTCLLWFALPFFTPWFHSTVIYQISSLFVLILSAILLYGLTLQLVKLAEMNMLIKMFQVKFFKK
jgi:putative peptidoglycan lipid II flippase